MFVRRAQIECNLMVTVSYSLHTSQARKRFTVFEVADDWHELVIPQRVMRQSIARASRHTTVPTRPVARNLPTP